MRVPVLQGLRNVVDRYEGFVLDLWGVVHDGVTVFPGVIDALERLHAAGKKLVFLSNAPRRAHVWMHLSGRAAAARQRSGARRAPCEECEACEACKACARVTAEARVHGTPVIMCSGTC